MTVLVAVNFAAPDKSVAECVPLLSGLPACANLLLLFKTKALFNDDTAVMVLVPPLPPMLEAVKCCTLKSCENE